MGVPADSFQRIVTDDVPVELSEALIQKLRDGDLEMPLLPDVASQVLDMARSADVDAARLTAVLHRDQTLAGHVLRLANSASYAALVPIVSLQQAISRLGFVALRDIVVAVTVRGRIFSVPGAQSLVQPMWSHALSTGYWAKEIARMRKSNVESAFLCGLLHDVGQPVVLIAIQDIQRELGVRYAPRVVENAMLHFHSLVGGALVEAWRLPETVAEAIYYHHDYQAVDHPAEMAMVTQLADLIAEWVSGDNQLTEAEIAELPVVDDLNFYPDEVDRLLSMRPEIVERVQEIAV